MVDSMGGTEWRNYNLKRGILFQFIDCGAKASCPGNLCCTIGRIVAQLNRSVVVNNAMRCQPIVSAYVKRLEAVA